MTVRDHTAFINASQELADLLEPNEGELVGKLKDIRDTRDAVAKTQAFLKETEADLRAYLDRHPDAHLIDGEHGLDGFLKPSMETVYDTALAIKRRDKGLYKRLEELGCIETVVNAEKVTEALKSGLLVSGDIAPFRKERVRSRSFLIKRVGE